MQRRDFFGIIAAPLLRRLTPPTPVAAQPVPVPSINQLRVVHHVGSTPINRLLVPGQKIFSGDYLAIAADGTLCRATDASQMIIGIALGPQDDSGMASVMLGTS